MNNKLLQPGIFSDDWTRQIFEHHNQEYGAFQLRRLYNYRIAQAFIISVTLIASFFIIYFSMPEKVHIEIPVSVPAAPVLPPVIIDHVKPPVDPVKTLKQILNAPIFITKDTTASDTTHVEKKTTTSNSGNGTDTSTTVTTGNNTGGKKTRGEGEKKNENTESKDSVLKWVQKMPEFPGGMDALNKFVSKKIRTNSNWRENGFDGKIIYEFVVGRDGNVRDIKISKDGVNFGIAELNLSLFDAMPQWKPGENNGHKVSVIYYLPVKFLKE
ncbi:MAG: energy transducer TonB [Bacteroidota bacterium]